MRQHSSHTHLQAATSHRTDQSLQKSVPAQPKTEFQNIFSNASKKNKTPDTQADTTMTVKLNNDNGLQTRWTRTPAGNMRLASCGVKCLNSSSVFQINFSAGLTVLCPEIPHERQARKRYDRLTK